MSFRGLHLLPCLILIFAFGCSSGGGSGSNNGNSSLVIKNISSTQTDSDNPMIDADSDGNVYLVWEETINSPYREVYYSKSLNSGDSFITRRSLSTPGFGNCQLSYEGTGTDSVSIATGAGGTLYLAWLNIWAASDRIVKFFREKTATCQYISDESVKSYNPSINLDGFGHIHAVWEEMRGSQADIFYRRSENNGDSFLPDGGGANLSNTLASDSSGPLLGFEGSFNVNVVWVEGAEGSREIGFNRSIDGGDSFYYSPGTISSPAADSFCPVIETNGENKIYIAYRGDGNARNIYFTRWNSTTLTFSSPIAVNQSYVSPSCPQMAVSSNGIVYLVWSDAGEIWTVLSIDHGISFSSPKNVSNTTGVSTNPKMVIDETYVNIVWEEDTEGKKDIYFSGSADHGNNFSSPPLNLSDSASPSVNPALATDGKSYIYISWAEGIAGEREIYLIRYAGARGLSASGEISLAKFLDISGDGKSDILIGAPKANGTGEAYIFYSSAITPLLSGTDITSASSGKTLSGEASGDQFGYSLAIAGDINGDGYADLIIGAPYADGNGNDSGKVYIYYGGSSSNMDNDADVVISGSASGDNLGFSVSPAGDVNGDGFDDILMGAPRKYQSGIPYAGAAYIFYGGVSLANKSGYPALSSGDADVILKGESAQDRFGSAVSWAGDFNKDRYGDVLVGAPEADGGGNNRGRAYIYYGGTSMDSKADIRITGAANTDQLGSSVARGGDINSDGYGDVIMGAPYADVSSMENAGKAYILYGRAGSTDLLDIDVSASVAGLTELNGLNNQEHFGYSLGYSGDVNNDGYGDILVGSWYLGTDPLFIGRSYIYLGGHIMSTSSSLSTPDVTFIGEKQEDRFGTAVSGAGDVNGDGYYDVMVGAHLADGSGTDRGKSYLYLGAISEPDNIVNATFTGSVDNGWFGQSLYRSMP